MHRRVGNINALFSPQIKYSICSFSFFRRTIGKKESQDKLLAWEFLACKNFFFWPIACARIFFWTAALCTNFFF